MSYFMKGSSLEAFNREILEKAEAKKAAREEAAANFIKCVEALNLETITLEQEAQITAIRRMYADLEAKESVTDSLAKLVEAEKIVKDLRKAAEKLKADKEAIETFNTIVDSIDIMDIFFLNDENIVKARNFYNKMSIEAKAGATDGLAKLTEAEKELKELQDAVKLAQAQAISQIDYQKSQADAKARAYKAQQETLKAAALNSCDCEQMQVLLAMVPYIGVFASKNQTLIAEAKKSRNSICYEKIGLTKLFFDVQYTQCGFADLFKAVAVRVVKKLTRTADLEDVELETVENAFANRYYKINKYFLVPTGAVFSIKRENNKTILTLAKVRENFELEKQDTIVLDDLV